MKAAWSLVAIGFVLMALELFVPGGVVAAIGFICLCGASVLIWMQHGFEWGATALLLSVVSALALTFAEVSLLKHSPLGRYFFLTRQTPGGPTPDAVDSSLGRSGEAVTTMAPSGIIVVDGKRHEAYSQDGLIERGTSVIVVGRDAFKLIVRRQG